MKETLKEALIFLIIINILNISYQKEPKLSKNDIEKIKKGLFLDSYMLSLNELFYNNTKLIKQENSHNALRKLSSDEITLSNVGFFSYNLSYATRII